MYELQRQRYIDTDQIEKDQGRLVTMAILSETKLSFLWHRLSILALGDTSQLCAHTHRSDGFLSSIQRTKGAI